MYSNILLCLDFSPHSSFTIDKAKQIVSQFKAKCYLIHVVEPIQTYGYAGSVDLQSLGEEWAEKKLKVLAEQLSIPKEQVFIATGTAKQEILAVAKEIYADLIILGNHGHHLGLPKLLGSTASAISHAATCDVLKVSTIV